MHALGRLIGLLPKLLSALSLPLPHPMLAKASQDQSTCHVPSKTHLLLPEGHHAPSFLTTPSTTQSYTCTHNEDCISPTLALFLSPVLAKHGEGGCPLMQVDHQESLPKPTPETWLCGINPIYLWWYSFFSSTGGTR